IERETDIVVVRERTRLLASLVGFDRQDQTRITTAVSEIVRNAWEYGKGGRIEYAIVGETGEQALEIAVEDKGRGISNLEDILSGAYKSSTGMGVGILGARRLMEQFDIKTEQGTGTRVTMRKSLPARHQVTQRDLSKLGAELAARSAQVNPI